MRIRKLSLKNFRQFFGEQSITFADSENMNVTVIHGENGSGKTALLNAFKWGFFEQVDFDTGKDDLLSERARVEAKADDELEMYIEIEFEHDGLEYKARRTAHFKASDGAEYRAVGGSRLKLSFVDEQGEFRESNNPETHIDQLFPQRLHSYFFFNGERIEKLANLNSSAEIKDAVKGLMGLEIIERAGRHVSEHAIKKFRKVLKDSSSGDLADSLQKEEELIGRKEIVDAKLEAFKKSLGENKEEVKQIDHRLKDIQEVAALQNRRLELIEHRDKSKKDLKELKEEKVEYISNYGFLAFGENMLNCVHALLADKRDKGELPGKIRAQFIDDLLDAETCICGRSLKGEKASIETLNEYKASSVSDDIENAFINVSGAAQSMLDRRAEVKSRIQGFVARADGLHRDIEKHTDRLDEIAESISAIGRDHDIEDIQQLEDRRNECQQATEHLIREIGELSTDRKTLIQDQEALENERVTIKKQQSAERVADARLSAAKEIKRVLDGMYDALSDKVKNELSEIVNDSFQKIIRKPGWRVHITDDYVLQVMKPFGDHEIEVRDKSTGEAQVTSLSFIGGLVALAKRRYAKKEQFYRGGLYPIVMDSPYGSLDPEYRSKVASAIPKLADQIIIMVSNSQWQGNVGEAVEKYVGAEYTLLYHTPEKKDDTSTASVIPGSDFEYTEVAEGYHA